MISAHLGSFLEEMEGHLPGYVEREFEAFLQCGDFQQGAAVFFCDGCGRRVLVPFSCKRRGWCPSCCGRRMSDIAANLCDRVLPDVPMRQWVLTVPVPVRLVVLQRRKLVGKVLAVFQRVVSRHLLRAARQLGICAGQVGAIMVEQRFGDGARCHWHVHALLPDGVFVRDPESGAMEFARVAAPTREDLARLVVRLRQRIQRLLGRSGLVPEEIDEGVLHEDLLGGLQAASMQGRIAVGPRAGWQVLRVGGEEVRVPHLGQGLCADSEGYNLHAGVHVPAGQRERLESLCRYLLRPAFAQERLSLLSDGRVMVRLKRPYSDGTRALVFEPRDFLARLCALVPPPRVHMVHYFGIFAPHSSWRAEVVPELAEPAERADGASAQVSIPAVTGAPPESRARRSSRRSWAELMKRTFATDILACGCGGRMRFLCFIFNPTVLAAMQGAPVDRPPAGAGARASPQMAWPWKDG